MTEPLQTRKLIDALRAEEDHRREDMDAFADGGDGDLADMANLIANSLGRIADSLSRE